MKGLDNKINKAYQRYLDELLDPILQSVREKLLIPFCKKHRVRFVSGMGAYTFGKLPGCTVKSDPSEWDDKASKHPAFQNRHMPRGYQALYDAFNLEIHRGGGNVYEYLDDYDPTGDLHGL